jgi:hypothetical protein
MIESCTKVSSHRRSTVLLFSLLLAIGLAIPAAQAVAPGNYHSSIWSMVEQDGCVAQDNYMNVSPGNWAIAGQQGGSAKQGGSVSVSVTIIPDLIGLGYATNGFCETEFPVGTHQILNHYVLYKWTGSQWGVCDQNDISPVHGSYWDSNGWATAKYSSAGTFNCGEGQYYNQGFSQIFQNGVWKNGILYQLTSPPPEPMYIYASQF